LTWVRRRWLPLAVLVAAVGLLVASIVSVAGGGRGPTVMGTGGMMGAGMGGAVVAGTGPVDGLDDAEAAAARFADRWGLTVGEVMQFDNGFYAELADPSGVLATEVLVDPGTGSVQVEFGPAMMWNTAYEMHRTRTGVAVVSGEQAKAIADRWLEANRTGEHVGDAEAFPGYYTMHTLRGEQVVGMLSVHAVSGRGLVPLLARPPDRHDRPRHRLVTLRSGQ
jgi:hypothetical protein